MWYHKFCYGTHMWVGRSWPAGEPTSCPPEQEHFARHSSSAAPPCAASPSSENLLPPVKNTIALDWPHLTFWWSSPGASYTKTCVDFIPKPGICLNPERSVYTKIQKYKSVRKPANKYKQDLQVLSVCSDNRNRSTKSTEEEFYQLQVYRHSSMKSRHTRIFWH